MKAGPSNLDHPFDRCCNSDSYYAQTRTAAQTLIDDFTHLNNETTEKPTSLIRIIINARKQIDKTIKMNHPLSSYLWNLWCVTSI